MNVFVILDSVAKGTELERFDEIKWEETKARINPARIIYVTADISDEKIKEYRTIIWDRIYNPISRSYEKIMILFSANIEECRQLALTEYERKENEIKDKIEEMAKMRDIRIKKRREENLENGNYEHLNYLQNEMNKLIPMETEEMSALRMWQTLNFRRPAGDRIEQIRKEYGMSWNQFIHFVDKELFNDY